MEGKDEFLEVDTPTPVHVKSSESLLTEELGCSRGEDLSVHLYEHFRSQLARGRLPDEASVPLLVIIIIISQL